MGDQKITELDALVAPISTDVLAIVDDPGGTPATKKITRDHLLYYGFDGWVPADETWTYVSATTFTVAANVTEKYPTGTKIRYKQGGA